MKKKIITAMRKRPGCVPEFIEIPDELEAYQAEVGGYIEPFRVTSDLVILCNEEGKLLGLPRNCRLFGETFVGTLLFVGTRGEHFADVPMHLDDAMQMFPQLWIRTGKLVEGRVIPDDGCD